MKQKSSKINNTNYCNTTGNPGTITATGEYITIRFVSDVYVQHSGFKILFNCTGTLPPTPYFSANPQNSCTGNIQFMDNSLYYPNEWLWDFGDGNTSTVKNPAHQYEQNGSYTVSLTVTNEYGSNTIQKEDFITVKIPDAPEIDDMKVCPDEEFVLTLDLEGTAYWYENIEDEEPVYVGNTWQHPSIKEDITYFLCHVVQAPQGSVEDFCKSSYTELQISIDMCDFVNENYLEKITISPNPSNGFFYLTGLAETINYNYVVTDITGKIIVEKQPVVSELIDLNNQPAGIYFLTISTSDAVKTLKLVNLK